MLDFISSKKDCFDDEIDYWKEKLLDVAPLNLSIDFARPTVPAANKAVVEFLIEEELNAWLTKFSHDRGVSPFVTLLSVFKVLLFRYSDQEDICVGNVITRKSANSPGFVNKIALRSSLNGDDEFPDLVKRVNNTTLEAYKHQEIPFDIVVSNLVKDAAVVLNPLFQVMFILQGENGSFPADTYSEQTSKYDLAFILNKSTSGGITVKIEYSVDLYYKETIERMADHYEQLLYSIKKKPGEKIGALPMLTPVEINELLVKFNDTSVDYSSDKTMVDLFEDQVKKTPRNRAVVFEDTELNYDELNKISNRFGDYLRKNYIIKPDDLVGIKLERSEWMIVVILGILKAGGAYVPIAPDYPEERINYLIQDSGCKVLIDNNELEKFKETKNKYSQENQSTELRPNNLAYCIYTSGSTGNPKGCLLEHRGLVNRLEWMQKAYPLSSDDVILQKTTFSFDVSVWEILWWAIEGASVCLLKPGDEKSPEAIVNTVDKNGVTVMHFVPSMLSLFLEHLENDKTEIDKLKELKQVFTSGEALTLNQAQRFNELFSDKSLMNLYGPTEASIDVTYFDCKKEALKGVVPIGKPIDNTQMYVLDKFRNLVPVGAPGEICIGGIGLARGYLNRPELTAEKFIENPFINEERIYRTGDLGRWRPDGNLEYLGRIDHQVKIRGFRIELDEISSVLQKHKKVKDAVVIAEAFNGSDKELIAYTTGAAKASELKEYLKEHLPAYMVPAYYVQMEVIPLTSNGKVNRKMLPAPRTTGINGSAYIAPSTNIEKIFARMWGSVLGIEPDTISINADFFDLGGHSIKAIRLLGLIHRELGVKISVKEIFIRNTIEQQVAFVSSKESKKFEEIKIVKEQPDYEVSSAQRRLWVLHHFEGAESAYNLFVGILLEGYLDVEALRKAFRALISRHETLRTVFTEDQDGNPRQRIIGISEFTFKLAEMDLRNTSDQDSQLKYLVDNEINKGFDLNLEPLLRCSLIKLQENKHLLVIVQHHIISDGWSMDIFRKELSMLYNGFTSNSDIQLPPLKIQYKDYAFWHTIQLESNDITPHKQYWIDQFQGDVPVLELPAFKERPVIKSYNGASIATIIDKGDLIRISKTQGGTLFMSIIACLKTLFYRYTNQEDIVIGSPTAGREHPDLEDQIGFYINTLALRTRFDGNGSFEDLYQKVREVTVGAYEHQLYPYDELVESLKLSRDVSRNPLFDVMVALQNASDHDAEYALNGLQANEYEDGEFRLAKFDITLIFSESKNGLKVDLEYNTDIYEREQIEQMLIHFKNIIASVASDPKQKLSTIDFLTYEEKDSLLGVFNNTIKAYPFEQTLSGLFEEQAARTPENIALRQHGETLSYGELNERANRLAHYLVAKGVQPGDNVGLLVTRGFDMIIGMYGIMKAGGAYVPIDPEYPLERQEYILGNSSVTKVIADDDYALTAKLPADQFVKISTLDLSNYDTSNLGLNIDSKQLAYTIYTSGSTGRPKGVMIEHHSAVNLIQWVNTEFKVGEDDRLLFITSMCFDLSVYDIFGMLASGGSLVIVEQQELMDVPKLKDMLKAYRITFWDSVPTTMDYLVRELEEQDKTYLQETLRLVFMSGDWIPVNLPDRIKQYFPNTRVISLGGATEGTVWSNFYPVEKVEPNWNSIPYGRPMDNNFFYILNEQLQPVPIGVAGELYIGGVGVARGYANDKEKTDYSFVKDPFSAALGGRMYRTGDLGRMLPDLNMEFIGRKDDQVKIRGFRIELGEIESVLRQSEQISQAVVLARADKEGKKRLVSYVVGKGKYDREAVINELKSKLPDYMVPTLWVELESLPLTSNGKIDKKALPEPDIEKQLKEHFVAPESEQEKLLAGIWREVLKLESVGIDDNFFDIGGHSLLAVQIVTKIGHKIGKRFPIAVLLKYPTIRSLNTFIQKDNTASIWKSLVPIKPTGSKTPLYIVHGIGLGVLHFNKLAGYVDTDQPVFGLQARGLDGIETPQDNIPDMAKSYIREILEHNSSGPYAIAGYSSGGFIAFEMVRQLEMMGKEVKMLAIFDFDAEYNNYNWYVTNVRSYFPKFMGGTKSLYKELAAKVGRKTAMLIDKLGLTKHTDSNEFYLLLDKIKRTQLYAYNNYKLITLDKNIYLFRAKICLHYNKDTKYLGWRKYTLKDVKAFEIPGDHNSMLLPPNVIEFANILQNALDNC